MTETSRKRDPGTALTAPWRVQQRCDRVPIGLHADLSSWAKCGGLFPINSEVADGS